MLNIPANTITQTEENFDVCEYTEDKTTSFWHLATDAPAHPKRYIVLMSFSLPMEYAQYSIS
jgi:hypothetical protein